MEVHLHGKVLHVSFYLRIVDRFANGSETMRKVDATCTPGSMSCCGKTRARCGASWRACCGQGQQLHLLPRGPEKMYQCLQG